VFDGELRTVKDILKVMSVPDFCGLIDINGLDKAGLSPLVFTSLTRPWLSRPLGTHDGPFLFVTDSCWR
jgi:hypothetical protein